MTQLGMPLASRVVTPLHDSVIAYNPDTMLRGGALSPVWCGIEELERRLPYVAVAKGSRRSPMVVSSAAWSLSLSARVVWS